MKRLAEKEPDKHPKIDARSCYSPDYKTARSRFLKAAKDSGGSIESLPLDLKGPSEEPLAIDIAWYGSEKPRNVVVHSSGLHGVEGFAGSAIQLSLLSHPPELPDDGACAFVHILNPFGMAWLRRFNENNVDLNRNWRVGREKHEGAAEGYHRLNRFFNPESPPSMDFFTVRAAGKILTEGLPALKQAIAGGQYEYPRGIFFGGRELENGPRLYREWVHRRLSTARRVCAIDVHTGLGRFGEDTLLVEHTDYDRLRSAYGNRVTALHPDKGVAFDARGGLHYFLAHALSSSRLDFLCQEFGTYGPIRVVHALREENRWHHYGSGHPDHPSKKALKEAFCPKKPSWRQAVLRRGREQFQTAVTATLGR